MKVEQIDFRTAMELYRNGTEVLMLRPESDPEGGWTDMQTDTMAALLERVLDGCLFFRDGIAPSVPPVDAPIAKTGDTSLEGGTKRTKIDTGKLLALHKAGWSQKRIAEELKVVPSTVCAYLKKTEGKSEDKAIE